ncbi:MULTISPECIES: RuBisCO accumulation factor 1 [Aerosakkonema]|uniref:RuBisCO accumulation factor 1 n=1 Tax=Aerosakkonema TaxID=1246629 RepID=UPI0035BA971E
MTDLTPDAPNSHPQPTNATGEVEDLLRSLRRKEGTWVFWGQACQTLQKAGYNPQKIFEETGFEPIQQNQVIVASQVYTSMVNVGVSDEVRSHFQRTGSDSLYEFRILTQTERAAAATFAVAQKLDSIAAKELAKAMKEISRMRTLPPGFTDSAGDALAYQYWKFAREQSDLQERSRLIANGLKYASSDSARQQIEKLLTDFNVVPRRPAPRLPIYRLEAEEELPRILPVVGKFPLSTQDLKAVPLIEESGPFRVVKFSGAGAWVPVPGWQVILKAEDPVAILCDSNLLPNQINNLHEEVIVVVDRADRQWDGNNYFIAEQEGQLQIHWFEDSPEESLLGRVVLVLRPKKILDENVTKDVWQIDE